MRNLLWSLRQELKYRLRCEHGEPITEFDVGMWGSMVDFIAVDNDKNMNVTFKNESEIE